MAEFIWVSDKDFSLRAEEIVRVLAKRPHMLLRITVAGPHFPHRDSAPFVRLVGDRGAVESLMAEISPDQRELRGYFPVDVEVAGRVEFGYASQVLGSVPIKTLKIARLDVSRVDPEVHRVTRGDLGELKQQR